MSALGDLESAVQAELAKPSARATIEGIEKVVLEAVKNVLEAEIPSFLRPFIGGLVDSLAEKGINSLESLTDKALRGLEPVQLQVGTAKLTVVVTHSPDLPEGPGETVGDWPTERNK